MISKEDLIELRKGVVIKEEGDIYILKNTNGEFFQIGQIEKYILDTIQRFQPLTVESLYKRISSDIQLEIDELYNFLEIIYHNHIITINGKEYHQHTPSSPTSRRLVPIINLNDLFSKLLENSHVKIVLRWLYSTKTMIALTSVSIFILVLTFNSIYKTVQLTFREKTVTSILAFLTFRYISVFLHEVSHGLSLKVFGRTPGFMGFTVIGIIPAFYCDVTEAWMLDKEERLKVSFAGVYIELLLSLFFILIYFIFYDLHVRIVASLFLTSTILGIVLNLTPIFKLDGYYILADLLGIYNLRSKAFDLGKALINLNLADFLKDKEAQKKKVYRSLIYYLCSVVLTCCFLTLKSLKRIISYLLKNFWMSGIWMFFFFIVYFFIWYKISKSSLKIHVKRVLIFIISVLFSIAPVKLLLVFEAKFYPVKVVITAPVDLTIDSLFVKNGEKVKRGQLLIKCSSSELNREILEKENLYYNQLLQLKEIRKKILSVQDKIENIKFTLRNLEIKHRRLAQRLNAINYLNEEGALSRWEKENFEDSVSILSLRIKKNQKQLNSLRQAERELSEEFVLLQKKIDNISQEISFLQKLKSKLKIISPQKGGVHFRAQLTRGMVFHKYTPIIDIVSSDSGYFYLFTNKDILYYLSGSQEVHIKLLSFPNIDIKAKLRSSAPIHIDDKNYYLLIADVEKNLKIPSVEKLNAIAYIDLGYKPLIKVLISNIRQLLSPRLRMY